MWLSRAYDHLPLLRDENREGVARDARPSSAQRQRGTEEAVVEYLPDVTDLAAVKVSLRRAPSAESSRRACGGVLVPPWGQDESSPFEFQAFRQIDRLAGEEIPEKSAQRVLAAAEKILRGVAARALEDHA